MRVAAGMCATVVLLVAVPTASAAQVTLTSPADGQTFTLADGAAVAPVAYAATLVPDPVACLTGSWYIERRPAGAGDDAWSTVAAAPATLLVLANTELRPPGDYEVRAALRCPEAAAVLSNVARIRVGDVTGQVPLPDPGQLPDPGRLPLPDPGQLPLPAPDPDATPVTPTGILPPRDDDTNVCLFALEDSASAAQAVRRARRALARRPSAKRRRALVRAKRQLRAARAAERAACAE